MSDSEVMWFVREYGMFKPGDAVLLIDGGDHLTHRVHSMEKGYTAYVPKEALSSVEPTPADFPLDLGQVRVRIEGDQEFLLTFIQNAHRSRPSGAACNDATVRLNALVFRLGQFEEELRRIRGG